MVKPTFICIGVQKGGTTALKRYLDQNEDIFMHQNELHFFDIPKHIKIDKKKISEYEKLFDTDKLIIGEKTPSYNYLQFAIDRIYEYDPNIKLILILREPISRYYSHYNHLRRNNSIKEFSDNDFINDIEIEEKKKLSELKNNYGNKLLRGYYDEIIEYILSKFNKNNIYIGISEEIKEDKVKYYNEIFNFLGAKEIDIKTNENNKDNQLPFGGKNNYKYEKPLSNEIEKKLYDIYKPHNDKLYKILGRKISSWENYYKTINI